VSQAKPREETTNRPGGGESGPTQLNERMDFRDEAVGERRAKAFVHLREEVRRMVDAGRGADQTLAGASSGANPVNGLSTRRRGGCKVSHMRMAREKMSAEMS
jgi:hypothetical protein